MHLCLVAVSMLAAVSLAAQQPARECFMLQALDGKAPYVSDEAECRVKTAPASTFKIPHSLIALHLGVVRDPQALVPWDGTDQPFDVWERAHSMDSAVKSSVFWFFRRTASLIGGDRMREQLARLGYAGDTFTGELTSFWVNGDLVVAPHEQLAFLRRMMRYELPVERKHVDAVKAAFRMPRGKLTNASGTHPFDIGWPGNPVVRAKTGNTTANEERVSWVLGHIESGNRQYVFVSRVRARGTLPSTAGAELAARMLKGRG